MSKARASLGLVRIKRFGRCVGAETEVGRVQDMVMMALVVNGRSLNERLGMGMYRPVDVRLLQRLKNHPERLRGMESRFSTGPLRGLTSRARLR